MAKSAVLKTNPKKTSNSAFRADYNQSKKGESPMRLIGYARVSTGDQNLDLQRDALERAGCLAVYEDHGISGTVQNREGLTEAMAALKDGDTFVVWRLDRLARSMRDLTDTIQSLHNRGIAFKSLCEHIDVSSAFGEFVLHVLSAVAHFERALIVERTKAGMEAAKERGAKFGRTPALDGEAFMEALFLIKSGMSVESTALQIGVGRSTLYRYLAEHKVMQERLVA
ncbi:MAG: recombinase family protein [Pseudomonadota bacterium]